MNAEHNDFVWKWRQKVTKVRTYKVVHPGGQNWNWCKSWWQNLVLDSIAWVRCASENVLVTHHDKWWYIFSWGRCQVGIKLIDRTLWNLTKTDLDFCTVWKKRDKFQQPIQEYLEGSICCRAVSGHLIEWGRWGGVFLSLFLQWAPLGRSWQSRQSSFPSHPNLLRIRIQGVFWERGSVSPLGHSTNGSHAISLTVNVSDSGRLAQDSVGPEGVQVLVWSFLLYLPQVALQYRFIFQFPNKKSSLGGCRPKNSCFF